MLLSFVEPAYLLLLYKQQSLVVSQESVCRSWFPTLQIYSKLIGVRINLHKHASTFLSYDKIIMISILHRLSCF